MTNQVIGGTVIQAAEQVWVQAGKPRGCTVTVEPIYREELFTLVPETLKSKVTWRCLEHDVSLCEDKSDRNSGMDSQLIAACDEIDHLKRGINRVQNDGGLSGFDPQHDSLMELILKLGEEQVT